MERQVISGHIMIVPNMLYSPASESEFHIKQFNSSMKDNIEKVVGREVTADETYVEIWAYDPADEKSNWACHSWPGEKTCRFPRYLPYKELEGLEEGKTLDLESEYFKISLVADQLSHRYCEFGNFQNVLKERKEVFDAWERGETIYIGGFPCNKNDLK